jgi:hypothetical protein
MPSAPTGYGYPPGGSTAFSVEGACTINPALPSMPSLSPAVSLASDGMCWKSAVPLMC